METLALIDVIRHRLDPQESDSRMHHAKDDWIADFRGPKFHHMFLAGERDAGRTMRIQAANRWTSALGFGSSQRDRHGYMCSMATAASLIGSAPWQGNDTPNPSTALGLQSGAEILEPGHSVPNGQTKKSIRACFLEHCQAVV